MKTEELLTILGSHHGKALLFEYTPGKLIQANYHITEIKNVTVDSVDCGGNVDFWKETVIQIYENPYDKDTSDFMTVKKANDILMRVDSIKPMIRDAEVKFEYSNLNFHTAQLFVADAVSNDNQLILKLAIKKTDCKAKDSCGIPEVTVQSNASNCAPGSGCC